MDVKTIIGVIVVLILVGFAAFALTSEKPMEVDNTGSTTKENVSGTANPKAKGIALNEEATFGGIKVTVRSVSEDSRCPKDVTCVWAGQVTVQATLEKGKEKKTGPITLNQPITFEGVTLKLIQVDPEKESGREISPSDYRFYFTLGTAGGAGALSEADVTDLIKVILPKPLSIITSPVTLTGEARGTWYFEASFPIEVWDASGAVIGEGYAEAQSDWMTTEYVPFKATVTFRKPTSATGVIILKKDNPSGLPEHDLSFEVPVRF